MGQQRLASFSVGGLLEAVASTVRPIAVEKALELRVVAPPGNDQRVGDGPALYRVLLNLATNALSKLRVETRHGWGTHFHFELDLPSATASTW